MTELSITFEADQSKESAVGHLEESLITPLGLTVVEAIVDKPWGASFRFDMTDADRFAAAFFPDRTVDTQNDLSPKFLLVQPGMALSHQYHARRSEVWRVLAGPLQIALANDDRRLTDHDFSSFGDGAEITIPTGVRHRARAEANWALIAEFWQHEDPANPSDEDDITRLADDFNRAV